MVQESYCNFEISNLLKKKGFLKGIDLRLISNLAFYTCTGLQYNIAKWYDSLIQDKIDFVVAPTHQMAMKWLREEYDLHIIVYPYNANGEKKWCCQVYETFNLLGHEKYVDETLDSYEDAVEEALKYCLENLI